MIFLKQRKESAVSQKQPYLELQFSNMVVFNISL